MATRKKPAAKGRKPAKAATKKKAARTTAKKTAKKTAKSKTAVKTKAKTKVAAKSKKATTRKTTARKTVAKKATARKTAVKSTAKKVAGAKLPVSAISTKQTKAQIIMEIADLTEIPKQDVKKVFSALKNMVERHVKPKGSGEMTIPELGIKIRRVVKKATKSRMGRNPFTGEEIKIAAKPARKSVKATALKALKELA